MSPFMEVLVDIFALLHLPGKIVAGSSPAYGFFKKSPSFERTHTVCTALHNALQYILQYIR
jgi:hypothetical protein